ncbi:MAG TPA: fimbria/pilus outer membrane usher protein [Allosphingosinicella sp.]|jgi:outer membrane usher protein
MKRASRAAKTALAGLLFLASAASAGEGAAGDALQPVLLDVTLNEQALAEPQLLLKGSDGSLYVSEAMIREWKLRVPKGGGTSFEGETYYRLDSLGAVRAKLDEAAQSLSLDAAAGLFERQSQALLSFDRMPMDRPGTGAFVNYDLFAEHGGSRSVFSGTLETGLYTPHGVAVSRFAGQLGAGSSLTRLESSWTVDRPLHLNSLRLGDSVSRGGPGAAPLRFAGVQFASNFAVQPGFVTAPLASVEGSAEVPSVVDVYVNNVLQTSRNVTPGPFQITNVPVVSGGGTVQLVVRDLLGRETVSTQSYYASSQMLRKGLHDFSYEAGLLRLGYGTKSNSYGAAMASALHRYGLSDSLTAEAQAQLSLDTQQLSGGLTASIPKLALVSGWMAGSRSAQGFGWSAGAAAERRTSAFSVGVRSEVSSTRYTALGPSSEERPSRYSAQAFADLPWRHGSIGANLIHRSNRGRDAETLAGLFGTIGLGRGANLQLYAQYAAAGERHTLLGGHLSFSFGGRRSASASLEVGRGRPSGQLSFQKDAPFGKGTGYRASVTGGRVDSGRAEIDHQTGTAAYGVQLGHSGGATGVRLSARGALGMVGGQLFASRALGGSFGAVHVPGHKGVRVYADNQLVGTTDSRGTLIVPSLRPYDRNVIRIEAADLPLDVQIEESEQVVRPYARVGAAILFASRRESGALLSVSLADGSDLPPGALVQAEGQQSDFVTASGGEVYVTGLTGSTRLHARWNGGTCSFVVPRTAGAEPQPLVEGLRCLPEERIAAR